MHLNAPQRRQWTAEIFRLFGAHAGNRTPVPATQKHCRASSLCPLLDSGRGRCCCPRWDPVEPNASCHMLTHTAADWLNLSLNARRHQLTFQEEAGWRFELDAASEGLAGPLRTPEDAQTQSAASRSKVKVHSCPLRSTDRTHVYKTPSKTFNIKRHL